MFKGMDVEGGRSCAMILDAKATELEGTATQLSQALKGFDWRGTDADRTRNEWDTQQVRQLQSVVEQLRAYSLLIRTQAEDQEKVSA